MPPLSTYNRFGGELPETAALTNVLASAGLRAPHTGAPFSEAMLFGIGGGPGAGYILWEFREHNVKVLVVAFHHLWQYPGRFYQALCDRIGVSITMPETGSRKAAWATLEAALSQGRAAVAWVDRAHMPYLQLPEALKGHLGHIVAVCGWDGEEILIEDRAPEPFRVPQETLADARGRIPSYKNRLLLVEGLGAFDLREAVQGGLRACVEHLGSPSDSFSLPTLRKWGRMMTDEKNAKGWPRLFADRRGLFSALRSIFESIALNTGAGALRELYADFLEEAAGVVGNARLLPVAGLYCALGERWLQLAEAALPDEVPEFAEAKRLLREQNAAILKGGEAWRESAPQTQALRALSSRLNTDFPLDSAAVQRLFAGLQEHLFALYEAETAALQALEQAL